MLNNSPWLWNARQTAAGMTARTSLGIRILQGKRTKGQSNPSPEFLLSQRIAAVLWPIFRAVSGAIRETWTNMPTGRTAANEFYKVNYSGAIDATDPANPVVVPGDLVMSDGVMTPTGMLTAVADVSDNKVELTWSNTPSDSSQSTFDAFWYMIHNRTKGLWVSGASSAVRSDGDSGIIDATNLHLAVADVIDIYTSFKGVIGQPNAGTSSITRYITTNAVA